MSGGGEWQRLCAASEVPVGGGARFSLPNRIVAVFQPTQGKFFCLDAPCYHTGGPLEEGELVDIEDADQNKRSCVICPLHAYHIALDNGESVFFKRGTNELGTLGVKQRTHAVEQRGNDVWVALSTDGECASDYWVQEALEEGEQNAQ